MPGNANSTFAGVTATVAVGFGGGNKVLQAINGKRNINTLRTIIIFLKEFIDFHPFPLKFMKGYSVRSLYPTRYGGNLSCFNLIKSDLQTPSA